MAESPTLERGTIGDKNDLAYWYPRLAAAGVLTPKTSIVLTQCKLWQLLDGTLPDGYSEFIQGLETAVKTVGGPPAFLRTGHGSGKHDWLHTCHVGDLDDLPSRVAHLVDWSGSVDFLGLPCKTWAVRELLDVRPHFTAFQGMPIGKERRYFFVGGDPGRILCCHPYWPPDSIRNPDHPNWRHILEAMDRYDEDEVLHLSALTLKVARHFDGRWSLDWLDVPGKGWVAIDMAEAEGSFHWPGCPNAKLGVIRDLLT